MIHLSKYLNLSGPSVHFDLQKHLSTCFCTLVNNMISEWWSPSSSFSILPGI